MPCAARDKETSLPPTARSPRRSTSCPASTRTSRWRSSEHWRRYGPPWWAEEQRLSTSWSLARRAMFTGTNERSCAMAKILNVSPVPKTPKAVEVERKLPGVTEALHQAKSDVVTEQMESA